MKAKKVRARKMWADCLLKPSYIQHIYNADTTEPVFVIPVTAEAYAAMRDAGSEAMMNAPKTHSGNQSYTDLASIFLASIGITPPQPTKEL